MEIKTLFAILAALIGTISFIPYLRSVYRHETRPHLYTWLIWSITQGTAAFGIVQGGSSVASIGLASGVIFIVTIAISSFWYGTKDITHSDTMTLIAALIAVFVWFGLDDPYTSIVMVTAIDAIGYIPTWRKSMTDPYSENILTWIGFTVGNTFSILALNSYNTLTLSYLAMLMVANPITIGICLLYRKQSRNS